MKYIFTLTLCLLMSSEAFSTDVDSDSTMANELYSDQNNHQENAHFVTAIVYDLASAKLSTQNSDFQKSYEYSKNALTAAILLNQDDEEYSDLLFLSLFSHIVSCDQLGLQDEGLHHLFELKILINSLELDQEDDDDEIIAYKYLHSSFNHLNEGIIKEELLTISEKFQYDPYNTFKNSLKQSKESLKSPQATKYWKRKWSWWKKQIKETCDVIKEICECLDLIEARSKPNTSTKKRN